MAHLIVTCMQTVNYEDHDYVIFKLPAILNSTILIQNIVLSTRF
jgi:hypothetical protein